MPDYNWAVLLGNGVNGLFGERREDRGRLSVWLSMAGL